MNFKQLTHLMSTAKERKYRDSNPALSDSKPAFLQVHHMTTTKSRHRAKMGEERREEGNSHREVERKVANKDHPCVLN